MFNLQAVNLAAAIRPGVRLMVSDPLRLVWTLPDGSPSVLVQVGRHGLRADSGSSDLFRSSGWCGLFDRAAVQVSCRSRTFSPVGERPSVPSVQRMGVTVKVYQSLLPSLCSVRMSCPARVSVWNTLATTPQPCSSSTLRRVNHLAGNAHLRSWLSIGRLALALHCASSTGPHFRCWGRLSAMVAERSPITRPASIFPRGPTGALPPLVLSRSRTFGDFGISQGSPPSCVIGWFSREVGTRPDRDQHLTHGHGLRSPWRPCGLGYQSFLICPAQSNLLTEPSFCAISFLGLGSFPQPVGLPVISNRPVARPLCLDDDGSLVHHLGVAGSPWAPEISTSLFSLRSRHLEFICHTICRLK